MRPVTCMRSMRCPVSTETAHEVQGMHEIQELLIFTDLAHNSFTYIVDMGSL